MTRKKDVLSTEFKVASEIYGLNEKGEKVTFSKLKESLDMSPSTINKALKTLYDWGIIKVQYGETDKGRAGKLLYISSDSQGVIRELYERFWKKDNNDEER